ncbi:hypothetical protein KAR91_46675 [Candidatus Pacearchaeota archaeon]|nr:hypothetical protein [Candidatus Pacearchaeota archaeon]
MKFLVCKKQDGDGCDYTIGCGMRYDFVEAVSIEQCIAKVAYPDGFEEGCSFCYEEQEINEAWIIPFQDVQKIDIEMIKNDYYNKIRKQHIDTKNNEERKEYERLKAKFE